MSTLEARQQNKTIAPGPVRRSSRLHWCCKAGVRSVLTRQESMRRWLRPISTLIGLRESQLGRSTLLSLRGTRRRRVSTN
jgi:hypothetical protein